MEGTVTVAGSTVIVVKPKDKKSSSKLNWWLNKTETTHCLSVTGIPLFANEACVRRVFANCGTIQEVSLQSSTTKSQPTHLPQSKKSLGYQQAIIKFRKALGVKKALSMKYDDGYTLYDVDEKLTTVSEEWKNELQASYDIDSSALEKNCMEYMEKYDKRKEKEEKANRQLADEPDEDGWITVTRNKFSRPPKAVKAHELKKQKKKKQASVLLHFYKNQVNDSKMHRIRELKAKFEEDKKRIQEMRQQRKFKPY